MHLPFRSASTPSGFISRGAFGQLVFRAKGSNSSNPIGVYGVGGGGGGGSFSFLVGVLGEKAVVRADGVEDFFSLLREPFQRRPLADF